MFVGYVYNDPMDSWEDGERAEFILSEYEVSGFIDSGRYYILFIGSRTFKLAKDEEIK